MRGTLAGSLSLAALMASLGATGPALAQDHDHEHGHGARAPEIATCTSPNRLVSGTPVRGRLDASDPKLSADNSPYEIWCLPVRAGQTIRVSMSSTDFDAVVMAGRADGSDPQNCSDCSFSATEQGETPATLTLRARRDEVFTVRPNTMLADQSGNFTLTATVSEQAPPRIVPLTFGQTVQGTIASTDFTDFTSEQGSEGIPTDIYSVRLSAGQRVEVTLTSPEDVFDPYLRFGRATAGGGFEELASDDDSGPGLGSRIRHQVESTGTYQIRVRPLQTDGAGPYSLRVGPVTTPARQAPIALAPGATARGSITAATGQVESGDEIYRAQEYVFIPRPNTSYVVTLDSDAFDAFLEVGRYDQDGGSGFGVIASNDDIEVPVEDVGDTATPALPGAPTAEPPLANTNARVRFTPEGSDPIIVRARALDGSNGDFSLRVSPVRIAPHPAAGTPVALGSKTPVDLVDGGPRRNDQLYQAYSVSLTEGQRIVVTLSTGSDNAVDPLVSIGTGTPGAFDELRSDDDGGGFPNSRMVFTAPSAGTYLILASTLGPDQVGRMELEIQQAPPLPAPIVIERGQTLSGQLSETSAVSDGGSRYVDYALSLAAGDAVVISLSAPQDANAETALDPYLEIGRNGVSGFEMLRSNDDSTAGETLNSRLRFVAPEAGTYTIRASALGETPAGGFELKVEAAPPAPPPPPPTPIAVGTSVSGSLARDDQTDPNSDQFIDMYVFEARAGERYVITLESEAFDSFLTVRGASEASNEAQTDDDSGGNLNSRLDYEVRVSGPQLIRVAPLGDAAVIGDYTVSVSRP